MKQSIGSFTLSSAILREDASIIDEDDSHLVLTVRVSKETVLRNHALLACLSDAVSGPDKLGASPWSPAAVPPQRRKTPHWIYAGLICLALAVPSPFIGNTFAGIGPPVRIKSVAPTKSTFRIGENIEIDFVYNRNRACLTTYDHIIERSSNEAPVYNQRAYGASVPSTNGEFQYFRLIIRPPQPLEPGKYIYVGHNHSECAQGGTYDIDYPEATFTVVE